MKNVAQHLSIQNLMVFHYQVDQIKEPFHEINERALRLLTC